MYGTTSGDNYRRKWDRDEYELKAQERLKYSGGNKKANNAENDGNHDDSQEPEDNDDSGVMAKEMISKKREQLKARDYKIDLESKLGKTVVISKATPSSQAGGFHCQICDCVVKDSINYLDHINGKKHQKNLGMSMRVKRSTLEDVKERFEAKLREKQQTKKEYDIDEKMKELKEEEEKLKEYRKMKRKEKKRKKHRDEDDDDDQMSSLMGFATFGATKKQK